MKKPTYRFFKSRLFYVILVVIGALLEGSGLGLLLPVFSSLETGASAPFAVGSKQFQVSTRTLIIAVGSIVGFRSIVSVINQVVRSAIVNDWAHISRSALYRSVHSENNSRLQHSKTGTVMNIVLGETWHSSEFRKTQLDLIARLVSVTIFGVVLLWVSWELTALMAILFFVPLLIAGSGASMLARKYGRAIVTYENEIHDETLGSLNGRFGIKAFNLEPHFQSLFDRSSNVLRTSMIRAEVAGSLVPQLLNLLLLPALIIALYQGTRLGLPLERVAVFVVLVFRTMPHAGAIVGALGQLGRHRGGHETVCQHLDEAKSYSATPNQIDLRSNQVGQIKSIGLDSIGFTYPESEEATIDDLTAHLEEARTYQVNGPSGSGKSTLLAMILGFYQPNKGNISINGQLMAQIDSRSFRQQVGYAGQRGTLFEGSLRDNILLGRHASEEYEQTIEERLGLRALYDRLPASRNTPVGHSGAEISGGERQRIQIARAILNQPKLLILDEATSELDEAAEASVVEAINDLCPDAIKLVVSHNHTGKNSVSSEGNFTSITITEVKPTNRRQRVNAQYATTASTDPC